MLLRLRALLLREIAAPVRCNHNLLVWPLSPRDTHTLAAFAVLCARMDPPKTCCSDNGACFRR